MALVVFSQHGQSFNGIAEIHVILELHGDLRRRHKHARVELCMRNFYALMRRP
jgi:hypothetical protein